MSKLKRLGNYMCRPQYSLFCLCATILLSIFEVGIIWWMAGFIGTDLLSRYVIRKLRPSMPVREWAGYHK